MKQYRLWFILFFVALLLRLGMVFYWEHRNGADEFYFGDSDTYWVLGRAIAHGEPYVYDGKAIHRMPGYPALLAPLFLVFGDHPPITAARVENAMIGSLAVLAIAWLAFLLFGNKTIALLAGLITAVDPLNIVMSALVLSEAPFCLAMVLQIAFWVKGFQELNSNRSKAWYSLVMAGLFTAATIYCRPSWLYFVPLAVVIGMLLSPKNFRPILQTGAVVAVVCAICLLPWWVRNYRVSGHFVSTTLQAGPSLYDGLNPEATGGSNMDFVENFRNAELKLVPDMPHKKLEYQLNQKMRQAAVDWAVKHPDLVWKLARSKFVRLWNFWPNEESLSNTAVKAAVFCTYFPVLVLGVIGAFRSFGRDFSVRLLWIPAVYITALHIVFVSSIRYRAPAMICFAVLAAWVLCDVAARFRRS